MKRASIVLFLFVSAISFGGELSQTEFDALQKELQPPAGEMWNSIPWKTGLAEAQAQAAAQKKPLFIWSMDGHPMGCT